MQLPHFHGLQIMAAPNESSEDVNDFLQRIRELGERRDKEDDERTKKLEEEILQGRKERQARRAGMPLFPSPLRRIQYVFAIHCRVDNVADTRGKKQSEPDHSPSLTTPPHSTSHA